MLPVKTGYNFASLSFLLPTDINLQGLEDGNKGVPEARSCHSRNSWLNHFRLINKFVLSLLVAVNWTTQPPMTHHYWRSTSELWAMLETSVVTSLAFYKDSLLVLSISFLSPVFPSPSPLVTRICNKLVRQTFDPMCLNLAVGYIYIKESPPSPIIGVRYFYNFVCVE